MAGNCMPNSYAKLLRRMTLLANGAPLPTLKAANMDPVAASRANPGCGLERNISVALKALDAPACADLFGAGLGTHVRLRGNSLGRAAMRRLHRGFKRGLQLRVRRLQPNEKGGWPGDREYNVSYGRQAERTSK